MGFLRDFASASAVLARLAPVVIRGLVSPPYDDETDNLALRLAQTAAQHGDRTAIVFEGDTITWRELDLAAGRVAAALAARGIGQGDSVSLLAENRIEFVTQFFGISRAGATVSLINNNLRGAQLRHCIETTGARALVFGSEVEEAVAEIKADCSLSEGEDFFWVADSGRGVRECPNWGINLGAEAAATDPMPQGAVPLVNRGETSCYLFTSGTTGMPKAAIQRHKKLLSAIDASPVVGLGLTPEDRVYLPLPLYHGTGLLVGFLPAMHAGCTIVLRRRFSASRFLNEIRAEACNAFVYIGELCRYILAQPDRADDGDNPLEKMMGNGLRPDIWSAFKSRFAIDTIVEFYGSSEGNTVFFNLFNRDQTIGAALLPSALVRYDVDADEVVRDAEGRCERVSPGEPGLLLGPITKLAFFDGYTDHKATEQKILRDVFEEGDSFFNSGDLVRQVDVGFAFGMAHYQFVDRVGDTFRWKGENCSTNEIGEILNTHPDVQISNVYGVELPGTDGRAGMAALVPQSDDVDFTTLSELVNRELASYARPVFIRIQTGLDLTGTYKLLKGELRSAAYHPDRVRSPVWVMKPGSSRYEVLDHDFYQRIVRGAAGY